MLSERIGGAFYDKHLWEGHLRGKIMGSE